MTRVGVPIQLRWGDQDLYGHVNNSMMARLLEEARVRALIAVRGVPGSSFDGPGSQSLVARQEIEYLLPVEYSTDPIEVQVWVTGIGGSSVELGYEVFSPLTGGATVHVRAATVLVFVDAETHRPRRLTGEERARWEAHLGDPVAFRRSSRDG